MPEGSPPLDRRAAAQAVERNFVATWQLVASAWDGELHEELVCRLQAYEDSAG